MNERYLRKIRLQIEDKAFTGLRIAARIEKTLKKQPNQTEIRVWNLSEESRKLLVKDIFIQLEAGYQDDTGIIFRGNLAKVDHVRQGPDWVTVIRAGDGQKELKKARANVSFKPGQAKPEKIVQYFVNQLTQDFGGDRFDLRLAAGNAMEKARKGDVQGAIKDLSQGYVAVGQAFDQLDKFGEMLGYDVSIQDKQITFLAEDETLGSEDVTVNISTGMVGSPEQAEEETVKVRSLLDANLIPGCGVVLKSDVEKLNGRYKVYKMLVTLDTHGPDWFMDLQMKRL